MRRARSANSIPYVTNGKPIRGYAPLGFTAVRDTGLEVYRNLFDLNTSLASTAASSATTVSVVTGTGITVGDVIGINLDNRGRHWTTVSSVSGTTIGLTVVVPSIATGGRRVCFNRWKTQSVSLT